MHLPGHDHFFNDRVYDAANGELHNELHSGELQHQRSIGSMGIHRHAFVPRSRVLTKEDNMKKLFIALLGALLFCAHANASSVNLTWSEPTTTLPYGFNVYRTTLASGTSCPTFATSGAGAWTQIVGSINSAQTTYSDTTISLNKLYCYAVTAYGTAGEAPESGPSNLFFISTTVTTPVTLPAPTGLSGSLIQ